MQRRYFLIINETHSLFPQQKELLEKLGRYETIKSPQGGWTVQQIRDIVSDLHKVRGAVLVFASPIPAMMKLWRKKWLVFANDNREKVELPDGKIISRVSAAGWHLL